MNGVGKKMEDRKRPSALLAAIKSCDAKKPVLSPGQSRRFRSKTARRAAFFDLLAMSSRRAAGHEENR